LTESAASSGIAEQQVRRPSSGSRCVEVTAADEFASAVREWVADSAAASPKTPVDIRLDEIRSGMAGNGRYTKAN